MLKDLLLRELQDVINKIKQGLCEMTQEQMEELLRTFAHQPMSKAQAFQYLGITRSLFDTMIKNGELPKGQKRVGFKELVWYRDEIENRNS